MALANGLTPKQEGFARAYVECGNATAAYRKAYNASTMKPDSVWRKALEVLQNVKVAARIQQLQEAAAKRHGITVEKVIGKLADIALHDVRKAVKWDAKGTVTLTDSEALDEATAYAISEVSTTANGTRIKFHDKQSALVSLGKHLGMFKDVVEHMGKGGGPIQVEPINDVEQARRIAYMLGRAVQKQANASDRQETAEEVE